MVVIFFCIAYGTSKIGVTALSKIQARAFSQDSREDILLNAVSCRMQKLCHGGPVYKEY